MTHKFHTRHATIRLKQRYHVDATRMDWINAFLDIVDGRSLLLRREAPWERYLVRVGGVAAILVYNSLAACIITALPPHR